MAATTPRRASVAAAVAAAVLLLASVAAGDDRNGVFDPCADTTVRRGDGFTFGVAFTSRDAFFSGGVQLSPCDSRLGLANRAQVALFRPQVDEISLLTVNSSTFDPVLEFQKGRLANLFWKDGDCSSCSGRSDFACVDKSCAVKTTSCKGKGGQVDCSPGIQLAFSGTDNHEAVLNSWYEVSKLRQYSLFGLFSNLKDSLTSQFNSFF